MQFCSTRGFSGASFEKALLSSLAPDGGLYVPQSIPKLTREELCRWSSLSYAAIAEEVMKLFIPREELSHAEIKSLMKGCYSSFSNPDTLTLKKVGSYHILELWHGPTGAFKDLPLAPTGRLVDHFLQKAGRKAVAVVGTSGDTGSAAIHSVLQSKNVAIVVLYPKFHVTELQKRQMTTVSSPNVQVFACDGTFDELDVPIRKVFTDNKMTSKHTIIGLNSTNISRLLFHAVHYIFAYLQLYPKADGELTFYVPTGAMGNFTGGYIAHLMGLPVKFVLAVNENDSVHRSISRGELKLSPVVQTQSSAMDIQFPFNLERLLYFLTDRDITRVTSIMREMKAKGSTTIPAAILEKNTCIRTAMIPQEEATAAGDKFFTEYSYVLCPHTAVGVAAAQRMALEGDTVVCLATATAAKFPEFVKQFGAPCPTHPGLEDIMEKPQHDSDMEKGQDWEKMLKKAVQDCF